MKQLLGTIIPLKKFSYPILNSHPFALANGQTFKNFEGKLRICNNLLYTFTNQENLGQSFINLRTNEHRN